MAAVDVFAIAIGAQLLLVFDHVLTASGTFLSLPQQNSRYCPRGLGLHLSRPSGPASPGR
ncbi:hypothetical protein AB0D14_43030 [Streptomyces sp. NPDC048484]|uniref:hypothetical protein n=1 Tax=Streptomyces sp. NPDC048484 TaxID=3155146 RepID=UPI003423A063